MPWPAKTRLGYLERTQVRTLLLLAEMNWMDEAVEYLRRASDGLPERAMVHYKYGLAAQSLKMANRLLEISPGHPQGQRLKAAAEAALRRQRAGIPGYWRRPTMRMQ